MKYFVFADIHGFYTLFRQKLRKKGFDINNPDHKIIICGDLMDRGDESVELQDYVIELMQRDKVILVRGNHEDLMISMLDSWNTDGMRVMYHASCHNSNGTFETALRLTGHKESDLYSAEIFRNFPDEVRKTQFVRAIIPSMVDYFETGNYIFVHGWIPLVDDGLNWRNATTEQWSKARWSNGMNMWNFGVREPNKTIVCGHYHCGWGWSRIRKQRAELPQKGTRGWKRSFEPFIDDGIIALDACTAYSGILNCAVIEV